MGRTWLCFHGDNVWPLCTMIGVNSKHLINLIHMDLNKKPLIFISSKHSLKNFYCLIAVIHVLIDDSIINQIPFQRKEREYNNDFLNSS